MALLSRSALLASLLWLAGSGGAAAQLGGPPPGPLPLFPPDNWWNLDISGAPVDPASGALIQFIGPDRRLHPDFGGDDPDTPDGIFGFPYAVVPGSQPLERVTFVLYGDESDVGAPGRPPGYPIPPAARTAPKWIEGGPAGGCDDADCHLLLIDRDHRLLFELYQARWTGACWEAGSGAIFPLDSNARRPEGWTSADAAGLAILPGLVRYDEAFGPEPIRHAFRFTVRSSNGHVFPASHSAGGDPAAPPLGARLRLKAGKDLSGYPPEIRRIFQAMKTYGLILADNGSDMYVQGIYDTRWNNDVLNPAFASLKAADFEVVKLGVKGPAAGSPCAPTDTRLCLGGTRFAVEAQWTTAAGANGPGHAVALTADTGYFWFFDRANVETVVKVLDACAAYGHRWVFATGLTDVLTTITVTDTTTGAAKRFDNPQSTPFRPIQDTGAFACP